MHLIQFAVLLLMTVYYGSSELTETDEAYLTLYVQIEKVKKSNDMLKLRMDMMDKCSSRCPHPDTKSSDSYEEQKKRRNRVKPIFDARVDSLPAHCQTDELPSNCAKATACAEVSGYYNITVSRYRAHTFLAFCDYKTAGGDWLHILQRVDGSENFARGWDDYVNGFGEVDRDNWIGLENLYALTNHDGPQELYVYMENFNGEARSARYDHFVIGNAAEDYKLKSLGKYSGNAGDAMTFSLNAPFSTYDRERDTHPTFNCAKIHKAGWWFKACAQTVPTGFYHHGNYKAEYADGIFWRDWMEYWHSMKFFVMMIRRQRIFVE